MRQMKIEPAAHPSGAPVRHGCCHHISEFPHATTEPSAKIAAKAEKK